MARIIFVKLSMCDRKLTENNIQHALATSPLLQTVRDRIRLKRYSLSTERTYLHHIVNYITWCRQRNGDVYVHPAQFGSDDIGA